VAFGSEDGTTWQYWGPVPVSFGGTVLVGLVVAAGKKNDLSAAAFDGIRAAEDSTPVVQVLSARMFDPTRMDLSATADDGSGLEQNLSYTWSVVRAPPGIPLAGAAQFSDNGTNAARNTTARFFAVGTYVLRVSVTNPQHLSGFADRGVDVYPAGSIMLSPRGVVVPAGGTHPFSAAVIDQFGRSTGPRRFTWSAKYGTVSADGLYTAPSRSTWDVVTATLGRSNASIDVYSYDNADGPALVSAVSRKVHGRRGPVDLPLTIFGAASTVEPRRGGATTLVLTFSDDVAPYDGTLNDNDLGVTGATFRSASVSGRVLTVDLADVQDGSVVVVDYGWLVNRLGLFVQGTTQVSVQSRFGDVDGSGAVNAADLVLLRRAESLRAAPPNLLLDLDLSGSVSATDVVLARRRVPAVFA
jgi:hypothetical protein